MVILLLDIRPASGATYYNFTDFLHLTNTRYQRCYAIVQFISKTKVISGTSRCSISVMPLGWGVRQPSLPRISPSLLCCKLLFQGAKSLQGHMSCSNITSERRSATVSSINHFKSLKFQIHILACS